MPAAARTRTRTFVLTAALALAGSVLPASSASATTHSVSSTAPFGQRVVAEAATHLGAPYVFGATGPGAFDCSGFTMYVFGRLGVSLPHSSSGQYGSVRHVAQTDRRVGDLI